MLYLEYEEKERSNKMNLNIYGTNARYPARSKVIQDYTRGKKSLVTIRQKEEEGKYYAYLLDSEEAIGTVKAEEAIKNLVSKTFEVVEIHADGTILITCKNGRKSSKKETTWLAKAERIGMDMDEALYRIKKLFDYGFNEQEITSVVDYWKKPNEEAKRKIPDIKNIIFIENQDRVLYYSIGYIVNGMNGGMRYVGIQSTAKDTLVESVSSILYKPLYTVNVQKEMHSQDFEGEKVLTYDVLDEKDLKFSDFAHISNKVSADTQALLDVLIKQCTKKQPIQKVTFEEEALIKAMKTGSFISFSEMNFARPAVLARLHSVIDGRKSLNVPGYGEIKAADGFMVFATMNPPEYAGTSIMNTALESRFMTFEMEPAQSITAILKGKYLTADDKDIIILDKIYQAVYKHYLNNEICDAFLSIRNYENALINKGFGTLNTSIKHNLLNITVNDCADKETMKEIIDNIGYLQ